MNAPEIPETAAEAVPELPAEPAPTVAAFGRWLKRQREVRDLSRDAVVRATRLTPAVIDGLESGEPARMPPAGYVFGYLRTYAGALGLDPDDVVLRWQEVEAATAPAEEPAPQRASPRAALYAAGGAALLGVVGALAWLLR